MAKLKIDAKKLQKASREAFRETALLFGRSLTMAISSPDWNWPSAPSPRDLVDTGQLRSSQQLLFFGDTEAVFSWNTEYAIYVHEGYTTRSGTVYPGRPWTQKAIQEFKPFAVYEQILQDKLR